MEALRINPSRQKLIEFVDRTSLRVEPEPTIRLASGIMSRYYVDCKQALAYPEARRWIGELMAEMVKNELDSIKAVGGMELGAIPVAIAVSDVIREKSGVSLPTLIVRKQAKEYGTKKAIEGPKLNPGDRVLVVEDVITTGGSTAQAIERIREAGLVAHRAIAIIDRMEGRSEAVTVHGVKLESLFTLQELPSYRG